MDKNEIVLYQPNSLSERIEVRVDEETVWLTQAQIAELFGTQRQAITKHLKNIFECGELDEKVVSSILELTTQHGAMANEDKELYHIGASLKDLGKKWFAFSKMDSTSVAGIVKMVKDLV